ncbi:t-SNARE [Wallemia mellicola]|nr:t-SNARE [Wallemia mellicola]
MARDRLAALRAQQNANGGSYDQMQHSYSTPQYEMDDVSIKNVSTIGDMSAFFNKISDIQSSLTNLQGNINQISQLHNQSLNNMDELAQNRVHAELDSLVSHTSKLTNKIKTEIKSLEKENASGQVPSNDLNVRRTQIASVKGKFLETIQDYQKVEQNSRTKQKQRIERQYRIVKPDASPDEIEQAVDSPDNQIFSQALLQSNRYGDAKSAYREVQDRHQDIKKIERTLTELAQLFNDMSILVEQQDETLQNIHASAEETNKDMELGLIQTERAVKSARAARRKRWICFWITIVVLAIIAVVLGCGIYFGAVRPAQRNEGPVASATSAF